MIYEIAGLKVEMHPKYERLTRQSESYRSSGQPDLEVKPDPYDMKRVVMDRPSEGEREYICCSAAFARKIVPYGRYFLHASAVVYEQKAYLFSAPSGTGKSTHTAFWRQRFPESCILNDDKPVIWVEKERITAWGTPFAGKTDLQINMGVPIQGICFLKRGETNQIRRIPEDRALALMLNNTWRPTDRNLMNLLLDMAGQVAERIPVYEMCCTKSVEAAELAYKGMKGT